MRLICCLLAGVYLWWGTASCELVQGEHDVVPQARARGFFVPPLWPPAHSAFSWWLGFWQTPRLVTR